MLKADLHNNFFTINISKEHFIEMWDDSFELTKVERDGGIDIGKFSEELGINSDYVDLDSFVGEQLLACLDKNGEESEDANNEFFEDYGAEKCNISKIEGNVIEIVGKIFKY